MIVLVERSVLGHHFGGGKDAAHPYSRGLPCKPIPQTPCAATWAWPWVWVGGERIIMASLYLNPGSDDLSLTP